MLAWFGIQSAERVWWTVSFCEQYSKTSLQNSPL